MSQPAGDDHPLLTRRWFLSEAGLAGAALAVLGPSAIGCSGAQPEAPAEPDKSPSPPVDEPVAKEPEAASELDRVALEQRIAQLLIVGFRGQSVGPEDPIYRAVHRHHVGGVLLFEIDDQTGSRNRNIRSPAQLGELVHNLHGLAPKGAQATLMVAIDQEGGYVNRLRPAKGFPKTLSARRLGRRDQIAITRTQAEQTAQTLKKLGINFNLTPVVDLMTNPKNPIIGAVERAYGAEVERVVRHAQAVIEGHHAHGIRCALKHFPGHGSSRQDSHLGFVDITDTWQRAELEPFAQLIAGGFADAVMTGHLFLRSLDPDYPATLSPKILGDVLRKQLGHSGVVISDDMHMGAITDNYQPADALVRAIEAGVDILTLGNNTHYDPDCVEKTVDLLAEQVVKGRLAVAHIDRAYTRVCAFKRTLYRPAGDAPREG